MRLPGLFFKEAVFVLHNFALKWAHFVTLWTKMADAVVILDRLHSAMVPRQLEVICIGNLHAILRMVRSSIGSY